MKEIFKGYYNKSRKERLDILRENKYINDEDYEDLLNNKSLTDEIANKLIENQISTYALPLGIATNFYINGKDYILPMVVEEPSVIAAASNAAKIMKLNGGISVFMEKRYMIGHIALYNVKEEKYVEKFELIKNKLIELANKAHIGICSIGGGVKNIYLEKKNKFLVIYLEVDVLDAMGANIINTMLEAIAPILEKELQAKKLMCIISNNATSSIAKATCKLKLESEIAEKIMLAYEFAMEDEYRAVTNNKGIFNGIDALGIACGNDFRAIEASGHKYACRNGRYEPLTKWHYDGKLSLIHI